MPVAIDFGTCNTVIARWNAALNHADMIKIDGLTKQYTYRLSSDRQEKNANVIPSLIHYGEAESLSIGAQVESAGLADHPGTFRWVKLDMLNKNNRSRRVHGRLIENSEAAGELINRMLLFTAGQLGTSDEELVITVPVEAWDHYVDWIQSAAGTVFPQGGQVIDEATACILGYQQTAKNKGVYAIFDFGGGTLDVSIVRTDYEADGRDKCRIMGRAGEELGGMLVDRWMLEQMIVDQRLEKSDIAEIGTLLLADIEAAKIALSGGEKEYDITRYNDISRKMITHALTRESLRTILEEKKFYGLVAKTVDRAVETAMDKYGVKKSDINGIFMVGGTSLLLGVYDTVKNLFPNHEVRCDNPFEAIAAGACRYVGQDFNPTLVHDYCLRSWSRTTKEYQFVPVIPRGTQYPTGGAVCGKYITAACAGADQLTITIYEQSEMIQPESILEVGSDGRMRVVTSENRLKANTRPLNPEDREFLFADPPCELGEKKRFVAGFGVDGRKRLTISLKDTRKGSQSYIKTRSGEKVFLPVKDFPMVRL